MSNSITDKQAREKLIRARTNLLVNNGFFGFLAMQLRVVEMPEIDTMAVDGKSLFYSPKFTHKLSDREREGVVCHEVMHCAYSHFSRRGSRDPVLWNIAGDFVINLDIVSSGLVLPGTPITLAMLLEKDKSKYKDVTGHMLDQQFKGMTTEAVYDKLSQHMKVIHVMVGSGGDPGNCGAVLDAPGSSTDREETQQTWETSVRMAVETARQNNAGNIPASLRKLIEQLKRPKISWREKTRRFIDQSMTKEFSWSRLSRRSVANGYLMPGTIADRLRHLVFFVDISGSVPFEMARSMTSEVAGALDEGTADMVTVAYADTRVQHVDTYVQGDLVTCGRYTGGGTDFADSFRWLKENAPDASCVVYLTDLEVYSFGEEPPCPVLWAVYNSDMRYDDLAAKVPFGMSIHIDNMIS